MSDKQELKGVQLTGWQADVVDAVERHEEIRDGERFQGIPDYQANRQLAIQVVFPKGSGHTYLANYLASEFKAILVYGNAEHLNDLTERFALNPETQTISTFEMFYALFKPDINQPCPELIELNNKFKTRTLIVVDNYLRVPQHVRDYILNTAQGPIVFLGH